MQPGEKQLGEMQLEEMQHFNTTPLVEIQPGEMQFGEMQLSREKVFSKLQSRRKEATTTTDESSLCLLLLDLNNSKLYYLFNFENNSNMGDTTRCLCLIEYLKISLGKYHYFMHVKVKIKNLVEYLVEHIVFINKLNEYNKTPLYYEHKNINEILKSFDFDLDIKPFSIFNKLNFSDNQSNYTISTNDVESINIIEKENNNNIIKLYKENNDEINSDDAENQTNFFIQNNNNNLQQEFDSIEKKMLLQRQLMNQIVPMRIKCNEINNEIQH
ncbi:hypothetical protein U3516DRAFT_845011 [Neocallimastix sp. 'constans']